MSGQLKRILVVDDDKEIAELVQRKLSQSGYQVVVKNNGLDAINEARNSRPDLVLMDIILPDMDGAEVVEMLQNELALKTVPILFLSGIVTIDSPSQKSEVRVRDRLYPALGKPFNAQQLLDEVTKSLKSD